MDLSSQIKELNEKIEQYAIAANTCDQEIVYYWDKIENLKNDLSRKETYLKDWREKKRNIILEWDRAREQLKDLTLKRKKLGQLEGMETPERKIPVNNLLNGEMLYNLWRRHFPEICMWKDLSHKDRWHKAAEETSIARAWDCIDSSSNHPQSFVQAWKEFMYLIKNK